MPKYNDFELDLQTESVSYGGDDMCSSPIDRGGRFTVSGTSHASTSGGDGGRYNNQPVQDCLH